LLQNNKFYLYVSICFLPKILLKNYFTESLVFKNKV